MLKPVLDYVHGRVIDSSSAIFVPTGTADTVQRFEVLAVGPGKYEFGTFIEPPVKVGDKVIIQKQAAEGDTPADLYNKGEALFMASRIMAVIKDKE